MNTRRIHLFTYTRQHGQYTHRIRWKGSQARLPILPRNYARRHGSGYLDIRVHGFQLHHRSTTTHHRAFFEGLCRGEGERAYSLVK
ncbi:de3a7595-c65a-49de-8554-40576ca52456-CDS [Sclerotinia trifoliorum]|uniref:De3a7595-c65a-49de-8554-40576ca52456-CDS n=1 Tax=Sclerotinia trifoliorum TaxID=28548 RepID=A0A8H2ZP73_9HELO|nr:de3a7595-c65a-49de-8554-40576ca52456-CDS [Sclerotinia trifoliorum]